MYPLVKDLRVQDLIKPGFFRGHRVRFRDTILLFQVKRGCHGCATGSGTKIERKKDHMSLPWSIILITDYTKLRRITLGFIKHSENKFGYSMSVRWK